MTKACYVGVAGKARKVKKIYTGVDNKARKVKKAYVGVGGKARPFFSAEQKLSYYGTVTSLSVSRAYFPATTVGGYGLFGGGYADSYLSTVDAYSASLVHSTPTSLSEARYDLAATTVGDYGLFGGGHATDQTDYDYLYSTIVDAYSTSLVRSTPTELSDRRATLKATTVGNYGLFGGGYLILKSESYIQFATVDAYSASLVRSTPTSLSEARYGLAATTVGDFALFGGGNGTGFNLTDTVDAYSATLVRSTPTPLSEARAELAATTVGGYALFGGGRWTDTVDAYSATLVRSTPTPLSEARAGLAATTVMDYGLFGGGALRPTEWSSSVDAYSASLVRSTPPHLSQFKSSLAATTVGDYALFGGGVEYNHSFYNAVDAYTVDGGGSKPSNPDPDPDPDGPEDLRPKPGGHVPDKVHGDND